MGGCGSSARDDAANATVEGSPVPHRAVAVSSSTPSSYLHTSNGLHGLSGLKKQDQEDDEDYHSAVDWPSEIWEAANFDQEAHDPRYDDGGLHDYLEKNFEQRAGPPSEPATPVLRLGSGNGIAQLATPPGSEQRLSERTDSASSLPGLGLPSPPSPYHHKQGQVQSKAELKANDPAKQEQLRRMVMSGCQTAADHAFLSEPSTLRRYLLARDGSAKHAGQMLKQSIIWRREWHPQDVPFKEMVGAYKSGKMYVLGHDRARRPIVYFRPVRDINDASPNERKILFFSWVIEEALKTAAPGVTQLTWIVDMQGYAITFSEMGRARLAASLLSVLQNHYPERVAKIILVQPPWFFTTFFAIIRPILSQRTLDKIVIASESGPSGSKLFPDLLQVVSKDQLEEAMGGELREPDFTVPPCAAVRADAKLA